MILEYYLYGDISDEALRDIFDTIKAIDAAAIIKRGWEQGKHIRVITEQTDERIHRYLQRLAEEKRFAYYDVDAYREKYAKIVPLMSKQDVLAVIYQNHFTVHTYEDCYTFENRNQFLLYQKISTALDRWYAADYFAKNDVYAVATHMYTVSQKMRKKQLTEQLESSGFISHLSHYIGFINSLKLASKQKVRVDFNNRFLADAPQLEGQQTAIADQLEQLFPLAEAMCHAGELNFYSPHKFQQLADKIDKSHPRHQAFHQSPHIRNLAYSDSVLCFMKWVLNVWYDKLLLLGFNAVDKFYMNFVIAKTNYGEHEVNNDELYA